MRKFLSLVFALFLTFISLPQSNAFSQVVYLTSSAHQNFSGLFENDDLAQELTPSGKLGQLVFVPAASQKTWVVDPALIDEVFVMTQGYTLTNSVDPIGAEIAQSWLQQFKKVSSRNDVVSLAYGNPDIGLANALAPTELKWYYSYGITRLQIVLGRTVISGLNSGLNIGSAKLTVAQVHNYSANRRSLTKLMSVVNDPQLELFRAKLAQLLSPTLNNSQRQYLTKSANIAVRGQSHKLRITSGKYQITTESAKLPVTVINDFAFEVKLNIHLKPGNSRVVVESVKNLVLPPQSSKQLEIQLNVIAPGQTSIEARIENSSGVLLVTPSHLQVNSTVIDKRVTWFTTGAAILLLVAAVTQSVRRVRKGKNNEDL